MSREMTVKELKEELEYYDDDMEVIFKVCDTFEPEYVTEDRWGNREATLDAKVISSYIGEDHGGLLIQFEKERW